MTFFQIIFYYNFILYPASTVGYTLVIVGSGGGTGAGADHDIHI
jgi:hypothetical protein